MGVVAPGGKKKYTKWIKVLDRQRWSLLHG